jgi:hypothetical protein
MKKFLLYICFALLGFTTAAQTTDAADEQPNEKRQEKIKALYVAYITQKLSLTPDEAQKFWPVHAQYEAELKTINADRTDELRRQQLVLDVKKKYQANFSKVLGADRCNNFYRHDGEFRKKMLERLKQMKQDRMNNRDRLDGKPLREGGGKRRDRPNPN